MKLYRGLFPRVYICVPGKKLSIIPVRENKRHQVKVIAVRMNVHAGSNQLNHNGCEECTVRNNRMNSSSFVEDCE